MMNNVSRKNKPHVVPLRTYLAVAAALLVLTAVTVGVSFIDLGGGNAIVAILIASVKALLVAFIFMHLLYDNKMYLIIFTTAILFLTIFIGITMFDILRRGDIYPITDKPIKSNAVIYEQIDRDSTHSNEVMPDSGAVETGH